MMYVFGIAGLLGVAVFVVLLIISFFHKSPKQRWVIGILVSVLCISFSIMLSLNMELNQRADMVSRLGEPTLSEMEIRGLAYEVIMRYTMGEQYDEVMTSLGKELNLSKQDMLDINAKVQDILKDVK